MYFKAMKRIRFDYYSYRLKKGRADILLQKMEGTDEYSIPCHYVIAAERLPRGISGYRSEDDGDLVLIQVTLNEPHPDTSHKEWIPLKKVRKLTILRNESLHVTHNIFRLFLDICPREGESGLMMSASEMLETLKVDIAKKAYTNELRCFLEGNGPRIQGRFIKQPDRELVRKEMETLEHFRLHKPLPLPMIQWDAELEDRNEYSYEPIDWKALGAEIRPISIPSHFIWVEDSASEE